MNIDSPHGNFPSQYQLKNNGSSKEILTPLNVIKYWGGEPISTSEQELPQNRYTMKFEKDTVQFEGYVK